MGGSMQQIWASVRAAQSIIFEGLTMIPVPYNVEIFLTGCMEFAQMDIYDAGGFYSENLEMEESGPFNENFLLMGIDS